MTWGRGDLGTIKDRYKVQGLPFQCICCALKALEDKGMVRVGGPNWTFMKPPGA